MGTLVIVALCVIVTGTVARFISAEGAVKNVITALVFFGCAAVGRTVVLPEVRAWEARRGATEFIEESRLFALLHEDHPQLGEQFAGAFEDFARRGLSLEEAYAESQAKGRGLVTPVFVEYARSASGESLAAYLESVVDVLDQLSLRDDDACYFWMFGQSPPSGLRLSEAVSERDVNRVLDKMADVVESAKDDPQDLPDEEDALEVLRYVIEGLQATHGKEFIESLDLLENPSVADDDRVNVCEVTVEFYRSMLAMSEEDTGILAQAIFGEVL